MTRAWAWLVALFFGGRWETTEQRLFVAGLEVATIGRGVGLWGWRITGIRELEEAAGWGLRQALTRVQLTGNEPSRRLARAAAARAWRNVVKELRSKRTHVLIVAGVVTVSTEPERMELADEEEETT